MPDLWSPDRCTYTHLGVQIRPKGHLSPDPDDPLIGAGELVSDSPIRGQDRYCRQHWGGRFQIAEHGGAIPTHCAMEVGDVPASYEGVVYIDPDTGGLKILSPTQNPRVYEARYGTHPQGGPV